MTSLPKCCVCAEVIEDSGRCYIMQNNEKFCPDCAADYLFTILQGHRKLYCSLGTETNGRHRITVIKTR